MTDTGLALDPVVVLGLAAREPRAHISDHKEVAMKLPIGPEMSAPTAPAGRGRDG